MTEQKKNWFTRHKILTVIIGVFVFLVIVGSLSGGGKPTNTDSQASTGSGVTKSQDSKAKTAKLNEAIQEGKFEFTVKGVECGKTVVGTNPYAQKTAQGQYCFMTLSVKNVGDSQQYFSENDQKLLNASSQQYSADSTATLYSSNNNTDVWLSQINPGNTVEGVLVFDIPKDQKPVTAELHEGAFSGGVKVSLE